MAEKLDAVALLKADHRKVEELFEKFEKAKSDTVKKALCEQICTELTVHATIEEEIFYPACTGEIEEDLVKEAYVEHDGAKVLIAELSQSGPGDDFYDAKVKVLSEEIKHHVKEEEKRAPPASTWTPWARRWRPARRNLWRRSRRMACRRPGPAASPATRWNRTSRSSRSDRPAIQMVRVLFGRAPNNTFPSSIRATVRMRQLSSAGLRVQLSLREPPQSRKGRHGTPRT
jgi:hypothetical protein